MKNFVIYKGDAIAKNSDAYKLWEEKKWAELDKHMSKVKADAIKRGEILEK